MRIALAFSLLAIGCVPSIPDGAFVCSTDDDCPPGQRCSAGVCHAGAFDGGSDAGVLDSATLDAGPTDAGAADSGVDADLVVVRGTNTFVDDDQSVVVPIDWTTANIELRYQTAATTLSDAIFPITLDDTTRGFAGVPEGSVIYARRAAASYLVTDRRSIHAGATIAGRAAAQTSTASGTALQLQNVTGLDAWQTGDFIELSVSNNGTFMAFGQADLPTPPAAGATTLSETISWSANHTPLVLGTTMMDRLRVFHVAAYVESGLSATHLTEQFVAPVFDLPDDGAAHVIGGNFVSLPLDQTAVVMWNAPAYEALRAEVGPAIDPAGVSGMPTRHSLVFQGLPNRQRGQILFDGAVDLVSLPADGTAAVNLAALHYANPYMPDDVVRTVSMQNAMVWRIPTATAASSFVWVQTYEQLDEHDAPAALTPVVAPPRMPAVNGMALTGSTIAISGLSEISVGAPVVISWMAPAHLATPTGYSVTIVEGMLNASGATRRSPLAQFELAVGTSFVVPPGVLQSDRYYHLLVQSNWRADPTTVSIPQALAVTSSSFFHTTP